MNPKPIILSIVLSLVSFSAFPQGSLTPPAAPTPTMKTLDQIEPRKEVNATNTPGDGSSVFKISGPGSYYLGANVTGVAGKHGVVIGADDVSLDLNGFEVKGVPGSLSGIQLNSARLNCLIRNGTIRDWDVKGIDGGFGFFAVYENLRVSDNGGMGIHVGTGSVVRSCIASDNGSHGFQCLSVSGAHTIRVVIMEHCLATGNGGDGFRLTNTTMSDCVSELNGGRGIAVFSVATEALTATNCTAISNTGDGISAGIGSSLTNCNAKENGGTYGIFAGEGGTLTGCTAFSNAVEHGIHADLRSTLTNCTASGNDSAAADSWGISAGAQSTISNCTASGNTNSNATPSDSTGGGILAGGSSTVQNCTAAGNKGDGIQIASDARVVENNCDSNGLNGDGAGIHSTAADNRIESNNVTDNDRGIDVDSTGSLIIKNSASGNTVNNYDIAADNRYGQIFDLTATGAPAATGNSAAGQLTVTTHPWANFAY